MEALEAILTRRSIRKYKPGMKISEDQIKVMIDAAIQAPTWKNSQTGRYYVAMSEDKINYLKNQCLPSFNAASCENAVALIITAYETKRSGFERDGNPTNELCMKSIPVKEINPNILEVMDEVKKENKNGVVILFKLYIKPSERYERYAGISVGVSLGNSIYIDAVGKGFEQNNIYSISFLKPLNEFFDNETDDFLKNILSYDELFNSYKYFKKN